MKSSFGFSRFLPSIIVTWIVTAAIGYVAVAIEVTLHHECLTQQAGREAAIGFWRTIDQLRNKKESTALGRLADDFDAFETHDVTEAINPERHRDLPFELRQYIWMSDWKDRKEKREYTLWFDQELQTYKSKGAQAVIAQLSPPEPRDLTWAVVRDLVIIWLVIGIAAFVWWTIAYLQGSRHSDPDLQKILLDVRALSAFWFISAVVGLVLSLILMIRSLNNMRLYTEH